MTFWGDDWGSLFGGDDISVLPPPIVVPPVYTVDTLTVPQDNTPRPATFDELLDIIKRITPRDYWEPLFEDPKGKIAIYRGIARMYAELSRRIHRSVQSLYFLPHARQVDEPASSSRYATFDADVERTHDLDHGVIVSPGMLRIFGPQGRLYTNLEAIEWIPFDSSSRKTIRFRAVAPGFIFNLEHLADPDGLITDGIYDPDQPPNANGPDFSKVGLQRMSSGRSGSRASIIPRSGTGSVVQDDGRRPVFSESDVGLYLRIENSSHAENIGRLVRIIGFEDPRIEEPSGTRLFPRRVVVDDGPQRVRPFAVLQDDGGTFTNYTVEAVSEATADLPLLPAAPAAGDALYVAATRPMSEIVFMIETAGVGDWELVWEYYDGVSWLGLTVDDGTSGFRSAGQRRVEITIPTGVWSIGTVDGVSGYFVRARVVSVSSTTTQPVASWAFVRVPMTLTPEDDSMSWAVLDWIDMGFVLRRMEAPAGGRDDDLRMLGSERGVSQQPGEGDESFRMRAAVLEDAVSPNAIRSLINRMLAPYGVRGTAFDVQDDGIGVFADGFFLGRDALSYPDGRFPMRVLYSHAMSYGAFFVRLPFIFNGEYGFTLGGGGPRVTAASGATVASALGVGHLGTSHRRPHQVYAALYDSLRKIKGAGVHFMMYRDAEANEPECP